MCSLLPGRPRSPSPRPAHRAGLCRGAALGLALVALAVGTVRAADPPAPVLPALLTLRAAVPLDEPPRALAVSADETLLAVAGESEVVLYDRNSRARLGSLPAEPGEEPALRFSPVRDVLLLARREGLEVWDTPVADLKPAVPLSPEHRLGTRDAPEAGPVRGAALVEPGGQVVWSSGGELYRWGWSGSAAAEAPGLWKPASPFDRIDAVATVTGGLVVVRYPGEKWLDVVQTRGLKTVGRREGHRFPVVAAAWLADGTLVSLDSGNTLVRWQGEGPPGAMTHLPGLPTGAVVERLLPLAGPWLLLAVREGEGVRTLVVNARRGEVRPGPMADGPELLAVSPTGRYVALGAGRELQLYEFAHPEAPAAYVARLRALDAPQVARAYVTLYDDARAPAGLKARLLAELERVPAARMVGDFLLRLRTAVQEENAERMRYWAYQILAVEPDHPEAQEALAQARRMDEQRVIAQGREAVAQGQYRIAISLLSSQVPADSELYGEASALIREAEGKRALETTLEQAREKLRLHSYAAARALVGEVLRKEPAHPAALALMEEIDAGDGGLGFGQAALALGGALVLGLFGLGLVRYRGAWRKLLDRVTLEEREPLRAARGRPHEPPPAGAARQEPPRPPPRPERPAAGPPPRGGDERFRREAVGDLLEKTEELVRVYRQADVYQQHASYLLELEAELNAIRRRLAERTANLNAVEFRLQEMTDHLRRLRVAPPPRSAAPAPPAREPTHYEVLRVPVTATEEEVRRAYHEMLKQYHPDLHNQSDYAWVKSEAERMSRRIGEAYEVLSDAARRRHYDAQLRKRRDSR